MDNVKRIRLLASGLLLSASAIATHAAAQAPVAGSSDVGVIIVTGSRIPQAANLTSTSPVQALGSQEFQLQGKTDTADLLRNIPQVTQNTASDLSSTSNPLSGPGGVATVDLRGLGPQRTLVLVDGKRLGIGDPDTGNPNPAPDINQVPSQLIQRVEVLTGGASAVYGSDAVAGVVNFIMKRDLKGLSMDVQYGTNQHNNGNDLFHGILAAKGNAVPKSSVWDGQAMDASLAFGVGSEDGKGHITLYATYHDQKPVSYSRRDYAACQLAVSAAGVPSCTGSSNSNIFYSALGTPGTYSVLGNNFITRGSAPTNPPSVFNSNPYEYLQHQDTRYTAGYFADYEINKNFHFYSDFSFMKDKSITQVAPAGLFQGSGVTVNAGFLVNCNNPLLSAQQAATICTPAQIAAGSSADLIIGRRNVEGGPRNSIYDHQNYRIVLGLKGDIAGPWKYDVYGQRYYTSLDQTNTGYQSLARIQNALQVVNVNGVPTCISGGSCVPFNIFKDGGVTPAAIAYLNSTGTEQGSTTESIVSGSITGDLAYYGLKTAWANDGVGVAFGAEYRNDRLQFAPDEAIQSGDLSGFGGSLPIIDKSLNVKELYAETRVPVIQDRPWAHEVLLEGGYRYSDYSTGVDANTFKLGAQWAPISDIRFRGSFQRAIRAPNIIELYVPQSVTNTSDVSVDPCAGTAASPAAASAAACARTGVTAAQYGNGGSTNTVPQCPANQCAVLNGGNPNLAPEKANTYSVGFTTKPSFLPGLTASVDYYLIKIEGEITNIPLQIAVDNCLATGNPTFCSLIRRAPNGLLFGTSVNGAGYIVGTPVNIGGARNSGVDMQASYNFPLRMIGADTLGSINFDFIGSYLIEAKTKPLPGEHTYNCAGLFGNTCQSVNPVWRHTLRASWVTPWNVLISPAWRHLSGVQLETNTNDPTLSNGKTDTFEGNLKAQDYFDLTAIWKVSTLVSFRAGVTNLFDKDPPVVNPTISGSGSPNTYTIYELQGRRIFVGLTANF